MSNNELYKTNAIKFIINNTITDKTTLFCDIFGVPTTIISIIIVEIGINKDDSDIFNGKTLHLIHLFL